MTVSIHQPEHLPWMGLLHKIANADVHVVLNNVQFEKNNFQNRNRIYTPHGIQWLTLPIHMQGLMTRQIKDMEIVANWKKKYITTLEMNYAHAPFVKDIVSILDFLKQTKFINLAELNNEIFSILCRLLNIQTPFIYASDLPIEGKKTQRLINILKELGASQYIMGKGGFAYVDFAEFEKNNIQIITHLFSHPIYKPFNFSEFTTYPSVIDVIANLGKQKVSGIIYENY